MQIPPGFSTVQTEGKVLKLHRSLYGLKQSPRDDDQGIEKVKQHLRNEFEVKDLGQMRYFLGMEVSRGSRGGQECKKKR